MFHRHNHRKSERMLNPIQFLDALQAGALAAALFWLIQPGMIFGFWSKYLARKQWDWPAWIRAPLGECLTCFSGQIGLWSGVILTLDRHFSATVIFAPSAIEYALNIIFHTVTTIVFARIINGGNQTN